MSTRLFISSALVGLSLSSFSQITITFNVDMTGQTIAMGGVHIAGQFVSAGSTSITEQWVPAAQGSQMTQVSGFIYRVQVSFSSNAAGNPLQFQFVRNDIWLGAEDYSEGNPGDPDAHIDQSCGRSDGTGGYNRFITIPTCDAQFNAVWNQCGTLTLSALPTLNVSPGATICPGQTTQLTAISNGTMLWEPSASLSCSSCPDPIASPIVSTLYIIKASIGGCYITETITILVDATRVNAGPDQNILPGATLQLQANGATSYLWQANPALSCTNCSSPVVSPTLTSSYVVSGTSVNGCHSSDTVSIFVSKPICEIIFFPTAFTPNNDNINDRFGPVFTSASVFGFKRMQVYNRWGELVFETRDPNDKWDGNFHGNVQAAGSYVYFAELDCKGIHTVLNGVVTLIR
jgi:gliding motility-associated-like protein